ncbi:MAG TPA: glutathione S-transferase family protein [Gammaproteobacteria bacterium]|nr:glutathione S-transferase family protein [Gammaproteobacteria bacterium]
MGLLVNGEWHTDWYDTKKSGGRFVRPDAPFRHRIEPDPNAEFPAAPGRYHLYVSLACPWAHRGLIFRKLKGLESMIGLSIVDPFMGDDGWFFSDGPGCIPDTVNGFKFLRELYTKAVPDYTGRVSVPTLWDKEKQTIVNNESSEIIRMFNSAFDGVGAKPGDYYPEPLRADIDAINDTVYNNVNNGVYKAGFATTQEAYQEAATTLFETLDELEALLGRQHYLVGDTITEADWRLLTTLFRFDSVYYSHFKCNRRQLRDYSNLWNYCRELYQVPGVAETVNLDHIKQHYYRSQPTVNPTRIVPIGPEIDFSAPTDRVAKFSRA